MKVLSLQLALAISSIIEQSTAYVCGGDPGNGDLYCGADVCCKGDGSEVCYDSGLNVITGECNPVLSLTKLYEFFPYPTTVTNIVATSYYVDYTTTVYETAYTSGVDTSYYSDVAYETTTITITQAGPTVTTTEREIVKRTYTVINTKTTVEPASTVVVDYTLSSGLVSTVTLGTTLPIVNTQVIGQTSTQVVTQTTTVTEDGTTVTVDQPTTTPTTPTTPVVVSTPPQDTQTTPSDTPSTPSTQPAPTTPTTVVTSATAQENNSNTQDDAGSTSPTTNGPSVVTVTAANPAAQSSHPAPASSSQSSNTNAAAWSSGEVPWVMWPFAIAVGFWVCGGW